MTTKRTNKAPPGEGRGVRPKTRLPTLTKGQRGSPKRGALLDTGGPTASAVTRVLRPHGIEADSRELAEAIGFELGVYRLWLDDQSRSPSMDDERARLEELAAYLAETVTRASSLPPFAESLADAASIRVSGQRWSRFVANELEPALRTGSSVVAQALNRMADTPARRGAPPHDALLHLVQQVRDAIVALSGCSAAKALSATHEMLAPHVSGPMPDTESLKKALIRKQARAAK